MVSWQEQLGRMISDPCQLALALVIKALVGSTIVALLAFTDWMQALPFGNAMPVWMRTLVPRRRRGDDLRVRDYNIIVPLMNLKSGGICGRAGI